ncbi:hypothetical protein [Mycolicibacterium sp. XJ1819]
MAVFDHLRPHSFVCVDEFPSILCREMTAVTAAAHGQVMARVLKANPARPWPQPPWRRRTAGARISLLIAGTVWFDLAGTGEESFSANDSWCLPAGLDHSLLEASSDLELLEIELPGPRGSSDPTSTIPEMLMLFASYSYRPIPRFAGPVHTEHPPTDTADPSAALSLRLDDSAPHGWAGCPWHLHDQGIQCGYLTSGSAHIDVEGLGVVDARPGTFWLQQAKTAPTRYAADTSR